MSREAQANKTDVADADADAGVEKGVVIYDGEKPRRNSSVREKKSKIEKIALPSMIKNKN